MRLLIFALVLGLTASFVFGKKEKSSKTESKSTEHASSKLKVEKKKSQKGSKKQMMSYPQPDDRQAMVNTLFGQGGPPAPGYAGGMGNGGLGGEMEGMPVGMGGGAEPLGFNGQDEQQGNRFPGLANGPSNYDENAEVGRGDVDNQNEYMSRFSKGNYLDGLTEGALSRLNGQADPSATDDYQNRDQLAEAADTAVTKAIGRPFNPDGQQRSPMMEQHQDSPFQQVRQESPFQPAMDSLASQASFAAQQMAPNRPGYGASMLGSEQRETPSNQLQPEQGEQPSEQQSYGGPEDAGFRATSMSGGEAIMGLNDQDGMKRHQMGHRSKNTVGNKLYQKAFKRKKIASLKKKKFSKSS